MNSTASLSQIISSVETLLQNFSLNQGLTPEAIALAFGNNVDTNELQYLEQGFILGDFSSLPTVEILFRQDLKGALGAYSGELDRIFISE